MDLEELLTRAGKEAREQLHAELLDQDATMGEKAQILREFVEFQQESRGSEILDFDFPVCQTSGPGPDPVPVSDIPD